MATNVGYASTMTELEALILHILPDIGPEIASGMLNSNLLSAALKEKGAIEEVEGGLEAWYGIMKNTSGNFKWQGKNEDMTADVQDPAARLRWDWKIFTGALVSNELDTAMNRGRAAIKDYVKTLTQHAKDTIGNQFNSALWNTAPGDADPISVPSLVSATPTTGTIGGLARSGNVYLQNGVYTTAIADIGSEQGISAMEQLRITQAVGQSTPDLIILDNIRFAGLVGYLATMMRYKSNEAMTNLRIKTIEVGDALIGFENLTVMGGENTITSGYMYGINTKMGLKIKHLKGIQGDGWSKEWERIGQKLNKALFYNWFGNLVSPCPRANFVATSVATA